MHIERRAYPNNVTPWSDRLSPLGRPPWPVPADAANDLSRRTQAQLQTASSAPSDFNFGRALELLHQGKAVARRAQPDLGIVLVLGKFYELLDGYLEAIDQFYPADVLANDWFTLPNPAN